MPMPALAEVRKLTPITASSIKLTDTGAHWMMAGMQVFANDLSKHYDQLPDPHMVIEADDETICAYWECCGANTEASVVAIRLSAECWEWNDDEFTTPPTLVPGHRYYFTRWRFTEGLPESMIVMGCVIRQVGSCVDIILEGTGMSPPGPTNGECLSIDASRVVLNEGSPHPHSLEEFGPLKVMLGVWEKP